MELNADFQRVAARYPHIAQPLRLLWGYPEAADYVAKLLCDTRGGARQGFPPDVLQALLNIQELHRPSRQPLPTTFLPPTPIRGRDNDPWDDLL